VDPGALDLDEFLLVHCKGLIVTVRLLNMYYKQNTWEKQY